MAPKPMKPHEAFRENVCDKKRGLQTAFRRVSVLNTAVLEFMVGVGLGKPCLRELAQVFREVVNLWEISEEVESWTVELACFRFSVQADDIPILAESIHLHLYRKH